MAGCGINNIPTNEQSANTASAQALTKQKGQIDFAEILIGRLEDFAEKERIGVLILVSMSERYAASLMVAALGTHLAQHFLRQARILNGRPVQLIVLS